MDTDDHKNKKDLPTTSGFTQAGVYARRQFCADLEVCRPPDPLWNPRLREAATTLAASGVTVRWRHEKTRHQMFDSKRLDTKQKWNY